MKFGDFDLEKLGKEQLGKVYGGCHITEYNTWKPTNTSAHANRPDNVNDEKTDHCTEM
jgi:hypothetical protein